MLKINFLALIIGCCCQVSGKQKIITVAHDGTGNYTTVQTALDHITFNNKRQVTVFIKNGIYKEKLHLDSTKDFVTLIGEDKYNTILTFDDHTGKVTRNGTIINTMSSYSFIIKAGNFSAKNITIQNDAGFTAGQAVALECDGDKDAFYNCRFIGYQDVLFTNGQSSRQFYKDCYIEGTTDFIFGSATVWFENCHIHSRKNSHVTAASTPEEHPFGYVFNDCVLTGDTSLNNVSLGRPWRPYASVAYIHCYLSKQIKAEGWSNWNHTLNYQTARYAEYENYGPGSPFNNRVSWSEQLNSAEIKRYTIINVLNGWKPNECTGL